MIHPVSTAAQLSFSLRVAIATISGAVVLTASLPRKLGVHDPLVPQLVAYGVLVALLGFEIVLLVRRRGWGRARVPALAATLAASVLSTWTLQPEYLTTSTDWSFGTTGWLAVVLLFGRSLPELVVFLAVHELVTVTRILALPALDPDFVLNLVAGSIGTIGFPLACGMAAAAMNGIAERADRAAEEAARIRTADAVATGLHQARTHRLARLTGTVEPILEGLADGSLDPDEPAVRQACTIEAARVRRLLAESDGVDDPLVHELRHGADVAERRGVVIELEAVGEWTAPGREVRAALLDGPLAVLATARTTARVTVIGTPDALSVNVVADGTEWPGAFQIPPGGGVTHTVVEDDHTVWIEARWTPHSP